MSAEPKCPECGGEEVQQERAAWVIRRFTFDGPDPTTSSDYGVSEDDSPPRYVCLECLYESSEPRDFDPERAS